MTMPNQTKGPSLAFIGLGVIILIAGVVIFVALILTGITGLGKDLIQVAAPGEKKLELTKTGEYTIFHEYRSVVGNKVYSGSSDISGLTVTVKDAAGNASTNTFKVIVQPSRVTIEPAVILRWNCGEVLQAADELTGPWNDIASATSPWAVPASEAKRFYRVRAGN